MNSSFLTLYGLLAIFLPACGTSVPQNGDVQSIGSTPARLRPIRIGHYEAAVGLRTRSTENFSDLSLQTQAEFIYGSHGDNSQLLLANLTLYAPDGLLLVAMERFEGLTSSVDCKGDDGMMSLTFRSYNAFEYALQEWQFINENDDGKFLLIANHDGCGPDDQRQPYLISNVAEDAATLTTRLTAQMASWSDVAGSYDMDFGHAIPLQGSQSSKRGLWGDIENVGKDVLNTAQGNADFTKSVTFDMSVGQQGKRSNIYTDSDGRLTLDCINCFVTGSFGVKGHLSVQNFELQGLTLSASPNDLEAELELEAVVTSSDNPDSLQYTKELFSFPIPDAGIEVEGIFKLGATLSYDIGVSCSFAGSATVDFGMQATIPNSAQLIADVQNPDQSSATNWGGGQMTPLFDIKQESASITLSAFSQPELAFGIELIGVGNVDVAVTVKLPEISVSLSAEYDEGGVCSQAEGSSQTGVKMDSSVNVEVDLQMDVKFGADEEKQSQFRPSWSKQLFGAKVPLDSMCFPLDIPDLSGTINSTTTSAASSLAASTTLSSVSGLPSSGLTLSNPTPASSSGSSSDLAPAPTPGTSGLVSVPIAAQASASDSAVLRTSADSSPTSSTNPTSSMFSSKSFPDSGPISTGGDKNLSSVSSAAQTPSSDTASPRPSPKSSTTASTDSTSSTLENTSTRATESATTASTPIISVPIGSTPTRSTSISSTSTKSASTISTPTIPPHTISFHTTTPKPSSTTSTTTTAATSTSSAEAGGGGCRMVKRFGKRMLIC